MATLVPMATPARQPFGVLNDTKLRNLQSVKNRQNAIVPNSAPSLKRRAVSPEISDSENVDPNMLDLSGKRKRLALDEDVSLSKPSRYSLETITTTSSKPRSSFPLVSTPRIDTFPKATIAPASAPAAGRSPTQLKRHGLLQPQSRKRFAPPSFGTKSPALSITAALSGTIAHKKARSKNHSRTIEESKPKSWFFDIFEEPEETQDYRMNEWSMMQSTTGLDISDDESKAVEKADRGKENVDPNEISAPVTRSMTAAVAAAVTRTETKLLRKNAIVDEPRTPLGDLNPINFYSEGLDATSVVLVHDETPSAEKKDEVPTKDPETAPSADFTFQAPPPESGLSTADISAVILSATPVWDEVHLNTTLPVQDNSSNDVVTDDFGMGSGDIEIWESESAKDENEQLVPDCGSMVDENVFALQDL